MRSKLNTKTTVVPIAILVLPLSLGCASLPPVAPLIESAYRSGEMPRIIGAQGPVSSERRQAVLDRLMAIGMLKDHLPVVAAMDGGPLTLGNQAALFSDGEAIHRAMLEAIRNATNHINLETYIVTDDEVGRQFADLLIQKRMSGVVVNFIYDGFGSRRTSQAFFDAMQAAGIHLLEFNPLNPFDGRVAWRPNHRDHRKLLIVDGRIAFTGGANIRLPSAVKGSRDWRDSYVRVEGPAVAEFQKLFMRTWRKQNGPPLADADYFPDLQEKGDQVVRVIGSTNETFPIYLTMISAILAAKRHIYLTTPYFVPDSQFLAALKEAERRGVEVRLAVPKEIDFQPALLAGRWFYQELLDAGVEIYERENALLHAKTLVIDGVWSMVGSANIDRRSFLFNDEIGAVVLGSEFADRMEKVFRDDMAHSSKVVEARWRQRPLGERIKEWLASLLGYWW